MNIKNFGQIVQDFAVAAQASASSALPPRILDFSVGSIFLAINQAASGIGLWLQGMILQVLLLTRAATSQGGDLDSWMADFQFYRLLGNLASGTVTFSRFLSTASAIVPIGAIVQTADGLYQYQVIVDTTNSYYSSANNGYLIPSGTASIDIPVVATTVGTLANVAAGLVNVLSTTISGVDQVFNPSAMTNGALAESDSAFRARFALYILGLSRCNHAALASLIANLGLTAQYSLVEFYNYAGQYTPGSYYVVLDDGTGSPSSSFLLRGALAIEGGRPLGIQATSMATVLVSVTASMVLITDPAYVRSSVIAAVYSTLVANLNSLPQGAGLPFYDLAAWAKTVPGCLDVTGVLLNGLSGDAATIAGDPKKSIKAGTVVVS